MKNPAFDLSDSDVRLVMLKMHNYHREPALFALNTGLRLHELLALEGADVAEWTRNGWRIREALLVRAAIAKGKKARRVPLNRAARAAAAAALSRSSKQKAIVFAGGRRLDARPESLKLERAVFVGRDFQPLAPRAFQMALQRAGRKSGIRVRVSPHVLRHTFASRLASQGIGMPEISALLGHASLSSTGRYVHPSGESLLRAVLSLPDEIGLLKGLKPYSDGLYSASLKIRV